MRTKTILLFPLLLASSLAFARPTELPTVPENPVGQVADAYLKVAFGTGKLDESGTFMHEDMTFIDPTAEVWPGPAAKGVQGRDRFIALQKSWNIVESSFETTGGFESGPHALRVGKLSWRSAQGPAYKDVPFAMMLRIEEGKIRSRVDFGDYDEIVAGTPSNTEDLLAIGTEHLEAYATFDEEILGGLFADDIVFREAHQEGAIYKGRSQVLKYLREVSTTVSDLKLKLDPTIVSYRHVLYTGSASFGLDTNGPQVPGGVRPVHVPFWLLLNIVDGEIVEQRDYTGLDHLVACLKAGGKE